MLHFLVDASLPGATAGVIRSHGHGATDVRDIGLGGATDDQIAAHARANGMAVISRDGDFGDITTYPPTDYHGLVVIQPPPGSGVSVVLRLVEKFLSDTNVLAVLPGRLAIVQASRIRLRPKP